MIDLETLHEAMGLLDMYGNERCADAVEKAAAELARIHAAAGPGVDPVGVLERLPKTKDGVTIALGMSLAVSDFGKIVECGVLSIYIDEESDYSPRVSVRTGDGDEFDVWPDSCYSTRAAAEAGRE